MAANLKESVRVWQSLMNQHAYETSDFTLPLEGLTDRDLIGLKWVSSDFLDLTIWACDNIVSHRQRPRLRSAIAYLNELRERQQAAFEALQPKWDNMLDRVNAKLEDYAEQS